MSMEVDFSEPYLEMTLEPSTPLQTPQYAPVSIAGRPFLGIDTSFEPYRRDAFRHRSIQAQRESVNFDNLPGVGTVSTENLWRREAWDWHYGAGQPYQDRKDSVDARFSISKGINPWMQWQVELLDDTKLAYGLAANAEVCQVAQYVYLLDLGPNPALRFTTDLVNYTSVTGLEGVVYSMTTDGYNVWVGTSEGIFTSVAGAAALTPYATGIAAGGVWYVGDRLMATSGNSVFNITTSEGPLPLGPITTALTHATTVTALAFSGGILEAVPSGAQITVSIPIIGHPQSQTFTASAPASMGATSVSVNSVTANFDYPIGTEAVLVQAFPSPLWTHPISAFTFSAMAAGSSQIYMAGYVAGGNVPLQSIVYRTTIEATGTALTIPVQALPMEGGEYATSLYGYLNYIFVGSNLGIRMCRTIAAYDPTGNEGDLEAGPLIPGLFPPGPVNSPVFAMTGNNRFVYFGWNNYDSESTGLGRCDLSTFVDTQAPAFASDLMVSGQGPITSMDWCTITNSPIFVVEAKGIYVSSNAPVASGYVESGYIGYDISDDKIALAGDIGTVQPQSGTAAMYLAADANNNIFVEVGSQGPSDSPNQSTFAINATRANLFSVKMTLSASNGVSPILNRWTLKALPGITSGTTISVVLALWEVENAAGGDYWYDPYVQKAFLENLRQTQTLFAYVEGPLTYPLCTVDEIDWLPEKARDANVAGGYQGNIIVYLKSWSING